MAFKTKQDYYSLGNVAGLTLVATSENKSESIAEAQGENGFVVATQTYGVRSAPACDYVITSNVELSGIVLGSVTAISSDNFCLGEITITTGAGQVPTLAASGSQVESGTVHGGCTCTMPTINVSKLHHAQKFGAFGINTGFGAHLTQCTFTAQCTVSTADKDGTPLAHDIVDGRCTVTGTIQCSTSPYTLPVIIPETGWELTSPLSETNPDGDFPTYTFTLTRYLTATA